MCVSFFFCQNSFRKTSGKIFGFRRPAWHVSLRDWISTWLESPPPSGASTWMNPIIWMKPKSCALVNALEIHWVVVFFLNIFSNFHPYLNWGRWSHLDEHIFQMGWNHQLGLRLGIKFQPSNFTPDRRIHVETLETYWTYILHTVSFLYASPFKMVIYKMNLTK